MINSESLRDSPSDGEIDFLAILRALWRQRVLVVAISLGVAVITAGISLVMEPTYRAELVVTEVMDDILGGSGSLANQLGGLAALTGLGAKGDDRSREARALLQSHYLVEQFIQRHGLQATLVDDPMKPRALWFAARRFKNQLLTVREDMRKGTITVEVTWKDPQLAAQWANDFVGLANELMRTRAIDDATRKVSYLNSQLEKTQVIELRQVLFKLIEGETRKLMLANARAEYVFAVVDPAVSPGQRYSPRRTIMVIVGGLIGFVLGSLVALVRTRFAPARL